MIRRLACAVLVGTAALTACGGATATDDGVRVPGTEPPERSGLVWMREADGRDVTYWVALEDGTRLASQPIEGPLFADGDALWQWHTEARSVPLYPEPPDEAPGEPTSLGTVSRFALRELVADADVTVIAMPELEAARSIQQTVSLEGLVGPYLFVREDIYVDAWGAHGSTSARAIVWDLRAASATDLLTERERVELGGAPLARARVRLAAARDAGEAAPGVIDLAAVHPRWDIDDGLAVELQFIEAACYACGDGLFGDYTRSVTLDAPAVPERLLRHRSVPRWVRATAERNPSARLMGFSRVERPEPARILDTLRR
ncbi:MAG: hypothetical protein AB7P00_06705 [Sandaracinaceae bacterium]